MSSSSPEPSATVSIPEQGYPERWMHLSESAFRLPSSAYPDNERDRVDIIRVRERFGELLVTRPDAEEAGCCREGVREWLLTHFPNRETLTIAELTDWMLTREWPGPDGASYVWDCIRWRVIRLHRDIHRRARSEAQAREREAEEEQRRQLEERNRARREAAERVRIMILERDAIIADESLPADTRLSAVLERGYYPPEPSCRALLRQFGDRRITAADAAHAGCCDYGVQRFRDRYFPRRRVIRLREVLDWVEDAERGGFADDSSVASMRPREFASFAWIVIQSVLRQDLANRRIQARQMREEGS